MKHFYQVVETVEGCGDDLISYQGFDLEAAIKDYDLQSTYIDKKTLTLELRNWDVEDCDTVEEALEQLPDLIGYFQEKHYDKRFHWRG